jgi:hypothetical protein
MTRNELIDLVAEYAIIVFKANDANPDVGMGMGVLRAIQIAEELVYKEAVRWNSLAALALNFDDIREEVLEAVRKIRYR